MEEGGEILLDLLRKWVVIKQNTTLSKLASPDTPDQKMRYLQGELGTFRALQAVLANPAERLRRLIQDETREGEAKDE